MRDTSSNWTLLLGLLGILYLVNIASASAADFECVVLHGDSIAVTNVQKEVVTFNAKGIETKINPTKGWMTKSDGKYKITYSLNCKPMPKVSGTSL